MSKQRPSYIIPPQELGTTRANRDSLAFWIRRVFRNSFTRKGRTHLLNGWCYKLQFRGRRKTFSLSGRTRKAAALEARQIYETVRSAGWEAAIPPNASHSAGLEPGAAQPRSIMIRWVERPACFTHAILPVAETHFDLSPPQAGKLTAVVVHEPHPVLKPVASKVFGPHFGDRLRICSGSGEFVAALAAGRDVLGFVNETAADAPGIAAAVACKLPRVELFFYSFHATQAPELNLVCSKCDHLVLKTCAPDKLFSPIEHALSRPEGFNRLGTARAITAFFQAGFPEVPDTAASPHSEPALTTREREILALVSQGCPDKQVAGKLEISIWTVHNHLKNVYEKLHVHNRTEAVLAFLRR